MDLLLDTHVFLWFISADPRLPAAVVDAIRDPTNDIYLSVASVWEVMVKYRLGKLPLPRPPETYLPLQRADHGIMSLPLEERDVIGLASLPDLHRDPFDRILICQAGARGLTLATADDAVLAYPGSFLRAK